MTSKLVPILRPPFQRRADVDADLDTLAEPIRLFGHKPAAGLDRSADLMPSSGAELRSENLPMAWIAGVDGYKSRWFVILQDLASGEVRYRIVEPFSALLCMAEAPEVVAVDIPIGLPEVAMPGGRACEKHARAVLGAKSSSVFNAVGRRALQANSQPEASASSRAEGGIGIGAQAWGLARKLREVDAAMTPAAQSIIREVHPEVCFWAMNGQRPMTSSKKKTAGHQERRSALVTAGLQFADALPADVRVGRDDFFDASAAAWTAARILDGTARRFPPEQALDGRGLDQAIWF